MFPLFETLCLIDGKIRNAEYHIRRFRYSYKKYYAHFPNYELLSGIAIPSEYFIGKVKLRIVYSETANFVNFSHYKARTINKLKLICCDTIDYGLKYTDRNELEALASQKGDADEVLIIKNGELSDTSFSNIVFRRGEKWVTPANPLLNGTCLQRLLEEEIITAESIKVDDLNKYDSFKLINAMNDISESPELAMSSIII